jgi:hypothetical protein
MHPSAGGKIGAVDLPNEIERCLERLASAQRPYFVISRG